MEPADSSAGRTAELSGMRTRLFEQDNIAAFKGCAPGLLEMSADEYQHNEAEDDDMSGSTANLVEPAVRRVFSTRLPKRPSSHTKLDRKYLAKR